MISLRAIRTRHFHNHHLTLLISSNSSKFANLSSIPQRPFSRSAQSSQTADEKVRSFTSPLSGFFRRVLFGEEKTDETNRAAAENAETSSEEKSVGDVLRKLEEKIRDLSSERDETVKNTEPSSEKDVPVIALHAEKRGLSALFTDREKGKSDSKVAPRKEKRILSALFSKAQSQSQSKSKLKSAPEEKSAPVERTAYGVEDPLVHRELSSDMKKFAEHLYAKGYLKDANFMPQDKFDPTCFEVSYGREFLKFAAVRFGEDHLNIAGWLSASDLKKVALFGCPSLGQRTVFAAKHMRSFFKIDEPKVCQACPLKELCKHPNKSIKHSTKLHLGNVIKVLVMYAMGSVPKKLVVPEDIRSSVSRLLKEITSLSQQKGLRLP